MFRILEGLLFCFVFSNAGFFVITHYKVGQPWVLLLMLLIFLVSLAFRSGKKIKVNGILSALFICGLMYLVGFTREPSSVVGLSAYIMPLIGFFYLFLLCLQSDRKLMGYGRYLKISLAILCLSIMLEPLFNFSDLIVFEGQGGVRLSGFGLNPNGAAFMIITLVVAIHIVDGRISNRIFCLAALCTLLTLSRSGLLCLVIIFILLYFRNITFKKVGQGFAGLLIIYISVIMLLGTTTLESSFFAKMQFDRINPLAQTAAFEKDSSRSDILQSYVEGIAEKPLVGQGPNKGMRGLRVAGAVDNVRAHNTILNIWYEVGILGALSFISFLLFVMVAGLERRSAQLVAVACLLFTFFINNLLVMPHFWLMVGLLLAFDKDKKEKLI